MSLNDDLKNLDNDVNKVKTQAAKDLGSIPFLKGKAKLVTILAGVVAASAAVYFLFF